MILCPNCQHHEITGALFCSECGAQLVFTERLSTQSFVRSQSDILTSSPAPETTPAVANPPVPPPVTVDALVSLHLVDNGQILPLAGRAEFTLGRVAEGQPILPDVDLSPYEAYAQGVSRLHAALKVNNQRVVVMDLGSSNGTRVNGQKIMPNVDYPVNHGDMLALGKLKIQVLIRR
jgi:pSer/pThr/pTyr-binding forkhead associated (FHA) protein